MLRHLAHYLIPHKGNTYRPLLYTLESVAVVVLLVGLLQMAFIAQRSALRASDYLASVLPSVLVTLANTDRAEAGVDMLEEDPLLARAAQLKAEDMAARGYFAHVDPEGREPWYWLDEVGYSYRYAGENLAVDFTESVEVEDAWMNSPTHKANILKGAYTNMGIGVAKGVYEGRETLFVVQFFAQPSSVAIDAPVPVAESAPQEQGVRAFEPLVVNTQDVHNEQDVRVLGVETQSPTAADNAKQNTSVPFITYILSAPSTVFLPLIGILFAVLAVAAGIALIVHISVAKVERVAVALVLVLLVGGIFMFDIFGTVSTARVPVDTQAASVSHVIY